MPTMARFLLFCVPCGGRALKISTPRITRACLLKRLSSALSYSPEFVFNRHYFATVQALDEELPGGVSRLIRLDLLSVGGVRP